METFTIQATGFAAVTLHGRIIGTGHERLDPKRAVDIKLYQRDEMTAYEGLPFVGTMEYLTGWAIERNFLRLYEAKSLDELANMLREACPTVLPPGAGYPAMDSYRERQQKLRGTMEVLALTALSQALGAAHGAKTALD